MKISTWIALAGLAWIVIENVANATDTANPLTRFLPGMVKIDNGLPGGAMFPDALPSTGVYLLVAAGVTRFGFGK